MVLLFVDQPYPTPSSTPSYVSLSVSVSAEMLENLLRALELDGLWDALSSCLTVVSVLEVKQAKRSTAVCVSYAFARHVCLCLLFSPALG